MVRRETQPKTNADGASELRWRRASGHSPQLRKLANFHRVEATAGLVLIAGARHVAVFRLAVKEVVGVFTAAEALLPPLRPGELVTVADLHAQLRSDSIG